MPDMLTEVPEGTSAFDGRLGQAFELALPGGGTTGYRWEARSADGVDVERLGVRAALTFGGRTREIFLVTPRHAGDIRLVLILRAPWDPEPADVREIRLKVR